MLNEFLLYSEYVPTNGFWSDADFWKLKVQLFMCQNNF
jgi:hypothetical protein